MKKALIVGLNDYPNSKLEWCDNDAIAMKELIEYNVDPKIQKQIKYASVVVCSNRPANNSGMSMDEIFK